MFFGPRTLRAVVAELAPILEGARLENVWDAGEGAWALRFTGGSRRVTLLVSTRRAFARLHAVGERPPAPAAPRAFTQLLRAHLVRARLEELRALEGERIAELAFRTHGGERWVLVLHLFGSKPAAILAGGSGHVLASSRGPGGDSSGQVPGSAYRRPLARRSSAGGAPEELIDGVGAGAPGGELPINRAIAERAGKEEARGALEERRRRLVARLSRERARGLRTREKVEGELVSHRERLGERKRGELLKGAFGELRRGMERIRVIDYFSDGLEPLEIALDPALSPQENVERRFRRARKAERAIPLLDGRLRALEGALAALARLEEEAARARDEETLERVERELDSVSRPGRERSEARAPGRRRGGPRAARGAQPRAAGPRRFRSSGGYEILVGRSARENDELTLHRARGNDLFLHVSGRRGAHVIVRAVPGKSVPPQTLLDAAQLALYYSLPQRSSGALSRGAAADVEYTPVKYVTKPKGAPPGAVLLARHKTVRIQLDEALIERLRREAGTIDPPSGT